MNESDGKWYAYSCQCCTTAFISSLAGDHTTTTVCSECLEEIFKEWEKVTNISLKDFTDAYVVAEELKKSANEIK
ncbi:MAG: hypothetical protein K0R18_421 [Bacillales bacterium]|nr:hypothetical protein [Bacillales bacterium]